MTVSLQLASGRVFAEDPSGAVRVIQPGSDLAPGEVVVTDAASAAVFHVSDHGEISIGASSRWDPSQGAPGGEAFQQRAAPGSVLEGGELGIASHRVADDPPVDFAGVFRALEPVAPAAAQAGPVEQATAWSEAELVAELAGLVRALQGLAGDTAGVFADLQDGIAAIQAGMPQAAGDAGMGADAVSRLFELLDRAERLAYREFSRHAGDEVSQLARGDGVLHVDALSSGLTAPVAAAGVGVELPAFDPEVLDAQSILEDLTVQPLGDLLQVENIAGATRMTVRDALEDETHALWLNLPRGGVDSLLGLDAPEFALPDTA